MLFGEEWRIHTLSPYRLVHLQTAINHIRYSQMRSGKSGLAPNDTQIRKAIDGPQTAGLVSPSAASQQSAFISDVRDW
jgi:hypothetical protein